MTNPQDEDDPLVTLEYLYRAGDSSAVREGLARSMGEEASSPEVSRVFGLLLVRWGELDAAVSQLESAVRERPDKAEFHNDLGDLYYDQRRLTEATTAFQRALECDPSLQAAQDSLIFIKADSVVTMATAEWRAGNLLAARQKLFEATQFAPQHQQARDAFAQANKNLGEVIEYERRRTPLTLIPGNALTWARIRVLFQEAVFICGTQAEDTERWWDAPGLETLFHLKQIPALRLLLRNYVFHRAGDYRSFLRISRELEALGASPDSEDTFLIQLAERFQTDLRHLDAIEVGPLQGERKRFLLAFPVWGKACLDLFLTCCLPSLMEAGNLPHLLQHRTVVLLIHTDEEGQKAIQSSPSISHLEALGIELKFLGLDPNLLLRVPENDNFKYWHLGLIQSLELAFARRLGADYHLVLPDTLYSAGYFRRLLEAAQRGNKVIIQTAVHTEADKVAAAVAPCKQAGTISVEPADLMAIALNCLHPSSKRLMINHRPSEEQWPAHNTLFWEEEANLRVISAHQSLAFVDASEILKLPNRFFFTLNSELDKLFPNLGSVYSPVASDGLVLAELSHDVDEAHKDLYLDSKAFAQRFWGCIENRRHLAFFSQEMVFPINPAMRAARKVISHDQTTWEMAYLRHLVSRNYPVVSVPSMMNGMLSLRWAEKHPMAEGRLPELREAVRRVWESGRNSVNVNSPSEEMGQILRNLGHFDLLPEVAECLNRYSPNAPMKRILESWGRAKQANSDQVRQWNLVDRDTKRACVIGVTLWGTSYLEFFTKYHLPSLLAQGNVPCLAHRGKVILSIVTDSLGHAFLKANEALRAIEMFAQVHFTVAEQVPGSYVEEGVQKFYTHYGLLDHHHVYLARELGATLILMPPDTVISAFGYQTLANHIDEGFDCCTIACIEARREEVTPALEQLRVGEVLSINSETLIGLAARCKTEYFKSLIVSSGQPLNAYPRELFWRVPGGYVCHSLFMHPLILSPRVMSRNFHPNHENVDWALLPRILQGDGRVKVLDDAADLFILHCSGATARDGATSPFNGVISEELIEYLLSVHLEDYPIHRRLFHQPQHFRVDDPGVPEMGRYLTDVMTVLAAFDGTMPQFR